MKMTNIKKIQVSNKGNFLGEDYFMFILQEVYALGYLNKNDIENLQLQCVKLLADKIDKYNDGLSSSIGVIKAESLMKSNLFTIGLFLKTLPDIDCIARELREASIVEIYNKGRRVISAKYNSARHIYKLVEKSKLITQNYTYNATISYKGIGFFFDKYNPDFEAHEIPSSIDYQLYNQVDDLEGVEFILKYLDNLYIENEFCRNFAWKDIHNLLCGYDGEYKDLLINIFEHVFTAAIGCKLANRSIKGLNISKEEVRRLYGELSKDSEEVLYIKLYSASEKVLEELHVSAFLEEYVKEGLPGIISTIRNGININTLDKVFVSPINIDQKSRIDFSPGVKMDNKEYGKFIEELIACRYSTDKLLLIKEKVRSFADIEDVLLDAKLTQKETTMVIDLLENYEIAALIKRNPFEGDIYGEDLKENEITLRLFLRDYVYKLDKTRKHEIYELVNKLVCNL